MISCVSQVDCSSDSLNDKDEGERLEVEISIKGTDEGRGLTGSISDHDRRGMKGVNKILGHW